MFWVSSDLGLFPTPQLPAEGARRGGRRPRSLRQSRGDTPLHLAALKGHAECVDFLLKAGAEKARPRRSQGGFDGGLSFKGQEGVERCRKQGFPGVPRRIPSLGTQNRSFTDSIQWPLSICLATSSWAVVHFFV